MPDELKGKIAGVIADARNEDYDGCLTMDLDEAVDSILSLIDSQRCEWTEDDGIVQTGCGTELWFDDIVDEHYVKQCPFCPCCGKRISIEVKDGQ